MVNDKGENKSWYKKQINSEFYVLVESTALELKEYRKH